MSNGNSNLGPTPGYGRLGRDDGYDLPIHLTRTPAWQLPGYDDPAPPWRNRPTGSSWQAAGFDDPAPSRDDGQTGWHHGDYFPRSSTRRAPDVTMGAARPFVERVPRRPYGFTRFPSEPFSPPHYIIRDNMVPEPNPRPSLFATPELPPRYIGGRTVHIPMQDEESKLTREEQKKALKMLKKEIYSPSIKTLAKRVGLHSKDINSGGATNLRDIDEDLKRCVICLEDFGPGCVVTITPCDHMFHEECIVPWVKSHGQCPICRFAFCERMRENRDGFNNGRRVMPADDAFANELLWMVSAMDFSPRGN